MNDKQTFALALMADWMTEMWGDYDFMKTEIDLFAFEQFNWGLLEQLNRQSARFKRSENPLQSDYRGQSPASAQGQRSTPVQPSSIPRNDMIDPTGLAADDHRCSHSNHFLAKQPANHLIIFWLKMKKSNSFHWFCEYNFKVITSNECQLCYFDGTLTMNEPTNNERNEERKKTKCVRATAQSIAFT